MTFNASMSRDKAGQLNTELQNGNNEQIKNISTIIQIVRPDVLLLNEFDFEPMLANVKLFQDNYLSVPHTPTTGTTTQPIRYGSEFCSFCWVCTTAFTLQHTQNNHTTCAMHWHVPFNAEDVGRSNLEENMKKFLTLIAAPHCCDCCFCCCY